MPQLTLDRHLTEADLTRALRADVVAGLTRSPKELPPKWLYDARGSELFEQITRLEEYYPTRREREILTANADRIAAESGADTLVELGSGSSEKTRLLLDALARTGRLAGYVPVDVSESALAAAAAEVAREYPGIAVHGMVGDFERHLHLLPRGGRRLIAFLGGTIGNLQPGPRVGFLTQLRSGMAAGDSLLLGTDLVKEPERLVRAYDDAAGVTAAFNTNILHVVNRELGADLDPARFTHVARWDVANEWIEMRLRSRSDQVVRLPRVDLEVTFGRGEEMRTEISAKFRRDRLVRELAAADLRLVGWWTDRCGDFALSLAVPDGG